MMASTRGSEKSPRLKWQLGGWTSGAEEEEEARLRLGADRHNHTAEPIEPVRERDSR